MEKIFYCLWTDTDKNASNSYDPNEKKVKDSFFTENSGYTKKDIDAINQLAMGESYNCEYGNHIVKRIQ